MFLFFYFAGDDNDGPLRYCILVLMAHMGRNYGTIVITFHSSLRNAVSI